MQFPSFYILTQLCHLVYVSFHMVFLRFYITVTRKLCSNQLEALHFIGFNKSVWGHSQTTLTTFGPLITNHLPLTAE